MVHIVVVDDHPVMLVGIREALRFAPDIQVVGQACDARSAVAEAVAKSPHVALVDLGLPAIDGVEAAELLSEAVPGLRILLLSEHFSRFAVERALRIHPAGLLLKSEAPERLAECIRLVMEGEQVFSSAVLEMIELGPDGYRLSPRRNKLPLLSGRERYMLCVLAEGLSLKQAARRLDLSYKAADHVKAAVMRKLGVHDRVDLARIAIREGLINVWDDNGSPQAAARPNRLPARADGRGSASPHAGFVASTSSVR